MNIFALHRNPIVAARFHCDTHVVKMILESAQLLCTAHRTLDGDEYANSVNMYKATHKNHPSAIWARETVCNYHWLYRLLDALCEEYTFRYGKVHKVEDSGLLSRLRQAPANIRQASMTKFAVAMPDEYKVDCPVESYRRYYAGVKRAIAKWNKTRSSPWFMDDTLVQSNME